MSVLWMRGTSVHYVAFRTSLTTLLLNGGNLPPTASVTSSRRVGRAPFTVEFDGGPSQDPDGSIATYAWDFGDGATRRGRRVSHTYSSPGRYFATLTVTDDDGDRDAFVVEVNVEG